MTQQIKTEIKVFCIVTHFHLQGTGYQFSIRNCKISSFSACTQYMLFYSDLEQSLISKCLIPLKDISR